MSQKSLFGTPANTHECDSQQDRIAVAAHRLTVYFTEEADLPTRYKKLKSLKHTRVRKVKEDAVLEKRFRTNVQSWTRLIETMLSKIDHEQAWRFLDVSPDVSPTTQTLTDCKDFCDFVDYLALRRDREQCCSDELGGLTWLLMPLQRRIEEQIRAYSTT
ncbi:MAG: hypothetical protein GX621_15015 [Pirellulaceae bacterium]|nr:hypothetical protein [Pirellulaceae bacterium]